MTVLTGLGEGKSTDGAGVEKKRPAPMARENRRDFVFIGLRELKKTTGEIKSKMIFKKSTFEDGARCRVRTCDPYRVKVVLYH